MLSSTSVIYLPTFLNLWFDDLVSPPTPIEPWVFSYNENLGPGNLRMTFTGPVLGREGFVLTVDGDEEPITYLDGEGDATVNYNTAEPFGGSATMTVSYTPGDVPGLEPFVDHEVINIAPP